MSFRFIGLVLVQFFLLVCAAAQSVNFLHYNISIENGLPESTVLSITEDKVGFIWVATPNFLCRYDGSDFKTFTKPFDFNADPAEFVTGKIYATDDRLWLITKGGKLEYMHLLTETIYPVKKFGNSDINIPALRCLFFEDDNRIYLGTEKEGVFIIDRNFNLIDHWHINSNKKLSSNRVNNLFKGPDGNIFVLTDKGVDRHRLGIIEQLFSEKNFQVGKILSDKRRTIFGTYQEGIWYNHDIKDNKELQKYFNNPAQSSLDEFTITSIEATQLGGRVLHSNWFGTLGKGLKVEYRPQNSLHDVNLSRNPEEILCMAKGYNNQLWIGTKEHGIYVIDKNIAGNFFVPELEYNYNSIQAFIQGNGNIIYTSKEGDIFNLNPDLELLKFSVFDLIKAPEFNSKKPKISIHPIQGSGEFIFFDDFGRVFILNPITAQLSEIDDYFASFIKKSINNEDKPFLYKDHEISGEIIIGNSSGLIAYDLVKEKIRGLSSMNVLRLVDLGNSDFVIISNKGIVEQFSQKQEGLEKVKTLHFPLPENIEISHAINQNEWLLVSTFGHGLYYLNLQNGTWGHFNSSNGLPNNFIMAMEFADSRTVWCSTNNGLFKMNYAIANGKLKIENIKYFNHKNGLPVHEFKPSISIKTLDGKICFGGSNSWLCFYYDNHYWQESVAKLIFTQVKVNNVPIEGETAIHFEENLVLDHDQNSIEFTFSALGNSSSDYMQYHYFLEGFDEDWKRVENGKVAAYNNLKPGRYHFSIKLADENYLGAPIQEMGIYIKAAFWQTYWFKIGLICFVLILIYLIYRVRIGQVIRLQKVKDEISADLHDDLGARLTTIQLLSAINKNKFKDEFEVQKLLNQIEKEVLDSSEALHDLVCNIKMNDSEINDFLAKLRRYFSETLDQANINYKLEFDDGIGMERLGMQKRRDIFFIAKELLNNVRKHSRARFVKVVFKKTEKELYLKIKDDGIGFDPDQNSDRNGLRNLVLRVERNKGKYTLKAIPGLGTEVQVWIPLDGNHVLKNALKSYSSFKYSIKLW